MSDVVIVSGGRTPIGALNGSLASFPAATLAAVCIREALVRASGATDASTASDPLLPVDEVLLGNVLGAGQGQNPARQAALQAGLPPAVSATTVNKVCGSGLKAVMLAAQAIRGGDARWVVAGGAESMSRAPHLLPRARQGYRLGHAELIDSLIHDGLWDAYGNQHMGVYGDRCASRLGFSRQQLDDFAVRSYQRARQAQAAGWFQPEIAPVPLYDSAKSGAKAATKVVAPRLETDEGPARFDEAKLRGLRPAFGEDGVTTAGNASSINDGAAALILTDAETAAQRGLRPLARIAGYATHSREPEWFTLAPIDAIRKLLDKLGWTVDTTDLFEINEAFAAVAMAAEQELAIASEKLNPWGGAVSLGHPIGASGARVLVTLLHALRHRGLRRGIASLCIGGGEAVAMAVEVMG
jgi:acetyl-CoA C-acetyltransferase